jgi:Domain of unknown function DUF29
MTTPDYDTDFYGWTQAQAAALRAKDLAALDLEHLAEEIADVGNSVRFAIERQMQRLLLHLLKLRYHPDQRSRRGWRVSVDHARGEIEDKATGSLRSHPATYLPEAYHKARRRIALVLERPITDFPEACPWSIAEVLDADFWPESGEDWP